MNKLRVGLIGLGNVAGAHLEAYKQVQQIEVVAGSDINREKLKHMAEKWKFIGYSDYMEMIEMEQLDIVCVMVPPRYHREVIEKIAPSKVNILCEKPLETNLEDAKRIIEISEKEKIKFYYGSTYRWLNANRKAREMIQQGAIGNISLLLEMFLGGQGRDEYQDLGDHHYPTGTPGGGGMGIMDHGIHLIDTFSWMLNSEVEYVSGRGNISGEAPVTEFLTMIFKNGAIGQLLYNEATYYSDLPNEGIFSWGGSWSIGGDLSTQGSWELHPGNIRIHGDNGALRVYYYANKLYHFTKNKRNPVKLLDRPMPGNFALQMESFVNSIQNNLEPEVTAKDGLKALAVALAAYKSFETKTIVKVEY